MELERETGWQLHPIGGDTGQAYMGTKDEKRLFLKRNTSPFLAALSLEGISPRLVWTKRIGNGDVLTAQEWCNGRTLDKNEMNSLNVSQIVQKVHMSQSLKRMLHRLGGNILSPQDFYREIVLNLDPKLSQEPPVEQALAYLKDTMPEDSDLDEKVVCHGDISHKNILITSDEELFLVDWDSPVLADPLYDIGQLLTRYIHPSKWDEWLSHVDYFDSDSSRDTLHWYSVLNLLFDLKTYHRKEDTALYDKALLKLNELFILI